MKGIETVLAAAAASATSTRSDHCPAMKGIETFLLLVLDDVETRTKRPLPRNEGD